jgi:putative ATP-dependent endonuclease of OLD family
MGFHISRVQIINFRNFKKLDVRLSEKAVIVGENASGKTNFIYALRLVLDPELPDSARKLTEEDFWDGLESPMKKGEEITITIDFQGFEDSESLLSILSDYQIPGAKTPTARITYKYAPEVTLKKKTAEQEVNYEFVVYGGDDESQTFSYQQRKWMPLQVLPALRDAETDLSSWRKSPLRPLLEHLKVTKEQLEPAAKKIDNATREITGLVEVKNLAEDIENRLKKMIGQFYSVSPTLGVAATDSLRLLHSLRLFLDGNRQRAIGDTSLGICNVLYLTLLILELERKESMGERASTIVAIEEPEAHLHPHLQRLVYRDFLRRESPILLTTHSPNIVSVSPIRSLVLIRNLGGNEGCKATSATLAELTDMETQDLERYLDATRGEILFAKGVILVEGASELYLIPSFAQLLRKPLDQRGISVCSVHGTDFLPYVKLLSDKALALPCVVITDGDPQTMKEDTIYRGDIRGLKVATYLRPDRKKEMEDLVNDKKWQSIDELLTGFGIFVGNNTLELDLCDENYGDEILLTIKELGAGKARQEKLKRALENIGAENDLEKNAYILNSIESIGKGRFAQRLSSKLTKDRIPTYIRSAIGHITKQVDSLK